MPTDALTQVDTARGVNIAPSPKAPVLSYPDTLRTSSVTALLNKVAAAVPRRLSVHSPHKELPQESEAECLWCRSTERQQADLSHLHPQPHTPPHRKLSPTSLSPPTESERTFSLYRLHRAFSKPVRLVATVEYIWIVLLLM